MNLLCLFICALATIICSSSAASTIESIDLAEIRKSDLLSKHKYLILLLCNEPTCSNQMDMFKQFDELVRLKSQEDVEMLVRITTDRALIDFYGISKFPSVLFFRDGYPIKYQESLNLKDLSEWIDNARERATTKLDDSSFEHLTQSASGATTGDWFVLL